MRVEAFQKLLTPIFELIGDNQIDSALEGRLNADIAPGGKIFREIEAACHAAIAAGWMCSEGGEGRRFGRVIEPCPNTKNLSVDVVQLKDIAGPHHRHPAGEICLNMPETPGATFDGRGAGWCVYEPGSAHRPTVGGGQALILYLLPGGKIEFT